MAYWDGTRWIGQPPKYAMPGQAGGSAAQAYHKANAASQAPGKDSLTDLVFGTSDVEKAFYDSQIARAQRSLSNQFAPQRSYALQALEARGLGRSSEVGRTLGSLGAAEGMAASDAIGDIQASQYAARQSRVNMYLNYLLQKKLQKSGSGDILGLLGDIGGALPYLLGGGGGGGGSAPSGSVNGGNYYNQPPIGPDDSYRGGP